MVLVGLTVAGALAAGWVRGGRLRHIAAAHIRGAVLAAAAAAAQVAAAMIGDPTAFVALTVASQSALLAFLWLNRYLAGAALVALGSTLNAVVIAANGAMPVSREAILAVSRHPAEVVSGRHRLLTSQDLLPWLADVIALPPLRTVVSVGDVVLAAGVGLLVMRLMQPPPRRSRTASAAQPVDGLDEPLA